jgi:hypothetical protein
MTIRIGMTEGLMLCRKAMTAALGAGLLAFAVPAVAQDTATQGPPDDNGAIGPRELQKFELPGTRTNPAYQTPDQPSQRVPAPAPEPPKAVAETPAPQPEPATAAPAATERPVRVAPPSPVASTRSPAPAEARSRPDDTDEPSPKPSPRPAPAPAMRAQPAPIQLPAPVLPPVQQPSPAPAASSTGFSWAYLLFVLLGFLLAIGTMRVWQMRQRAKPVMRTAPRPRAAVPEPAAAQPVPVVPPPTPQKRAPRPSFDNVSTGDVVGVQIRPWLQLEFKPDRAAATLTEAAVQYELAISNVGNAVARNVRIEARMFNAGSEQEREIKAFFASSVDEGKSAQVLAIPPRKGARLRNVVAMPKEHVREINVQGRRLFIPLVAFNVIYEWGEGKSGQTSMSYLVGREPDTPSDKMGAFRLDLGPRVYRSVAQRPSEVAVQV